MKKYIPSGYHYCNKCENRIDSAVTPEGRYRCKQCGPVYHEVDVTYISVKKWPKQYSFNEMMDRLKKGQYLTSTRG